MAKKEISVPTFDQLMIPTLKALQALGGSGSIEEINLKVFELEKFSEEVIQIPYNDQNSKSKIEGRLGWARAYLKIFGLLENSARGVYALTRADFDISKVDVPSLLRDFRKEQRAKKSSKGSSKVLEIEENLNPEPETESFDDWKEELLATLYEIPPAAFERLAQRILRESGFSHVEVTGKTNDGGIDGKGIARMSGLLSFHVIFQCKRYRGSVSPSQIRDFRGAMQGRADKGLFITTGNFTRDAVREATRDGAPPIDLIDGDALCEKLKELKLGLQIELKEIVSIKRDWFSGL